MFERKIMVARIAVPYDADGSVFQHFGKATEFKIYEIVDNAVEKSKVVGCDGGGHDLIGLWLVQQGVNAVICGGIGPGAQGALAAAGVAVFPGVEGSADDAIARLVDMGVKPFLVATSLRAVMAQRLLRRVCKECREEHTPTATEIRMLNLTPEYLANHKFYKGTGCRKCGGTGYKGRIGIYEIFEVTGFIDILTIE